MIMSWQNAVGSFVNLQNYLLDPISETNSFWLIDGIIKTQHTYVKLGQKNTFERKKKRYLKQKYGKVKQISTLQTQDLDWHASLNETKDRQLI